MGIYRWREITNIRGFIIDMDGVLWKDSHPIGNLTEIFNLIRSKNYKFILATNNSTRTPQQYVEKLRTFGVNISSSEVITSSQVVVDFLRKKFPDGGNVFVIGEDGLLKALEGSNFKLEEDNIKAVLVGMDRNFNYNKLRKATLLIRAGALFIGSNSDKTFPTPEGLVPGAGAILASIEVATNQKPFVVGKPAPEMYQLALERMELKPEETLVIGDRLETDISGGYDLGCATALVLSGVTSLDQALEFPLPIDFIVSDLTSLLLKLL